MCGISVHVHAVTSPSTIPNPLILSRGPDQDASHRIDTRTIKRRIEFLSSVLHLRGPKLCPQPVILPSKSVLCWNGQIYRYQYEQCTSHNLNSQNDTELLVKQLIALESTVSCSIEFGLALRNMFESMEAEFAFVFYHEASQMIYFGRDWFGRRSLLIDVSTNDLVISSVDQASSEINPEGIHRIDLASSSLIESHTCISWSHTYTNINTQLAQIYTGPSNPEFLPLEIPNSIQIAMIQFHDLLSDAVRVRTLAHPPQIGARITPGAAQIAILFSGGLDCSVIAALVHANLPPKYPIELVNVAFANPRSLAANPKSNQSPNSDPYLVPDRITALQRVIELRKVFPGRDWQLNLCNVPHINVDRYRIHIMKLMYPAATVMDFSIAIAFWFASRNSNARILLSGLGADEQLGGYSRHRGAFDNAIRSGLGESRAWKNLVDQVQLDVSRIAGRNLGRDDRVISDNGCEVRFPFLDTKVVQHLTDLPISVKCDMRFNKGIGDKLLLRLLAKHRLGLSGAALEHKRAIQFGARSAKLELGSGRVTGHQQLAVT